MATVTGKRIERAHPDLLQALDALADRYNRNIYAQSVGRTDAEQAYLYDGWIRRKPGFNPANPPGMTLAQGGSRHRYVEGKQMALAADITPGAEFFGWNPPGVLSFPISRESWHIQLEYIPSKLWVPGGTNEPGVLKMGSSGPSVRSLQSDLQYVTGQKLEVRPGVFDGVFGPATNHVVVFFQGREGLVKDGIVGTATQAKLKQRVFEKMYEDRFKFNRYANIKRVLVRGSVGDDVKAVQQGLNSIGQDVGTPDGKFGDKTYQAVINIQNLAWLESTPEKVDGKVGQETLRWLDFLQDNASK